MITAKKYLEVIEVNYLDGFRLDISFSDGVKREVDLTRLLEAPPPVFQAISNELNFSKVHINPVSGISWECGADLSAEFLKEYK